MNTHLLSGFFTGFFSGIGIILINNINIDKIDFEKIKLDKTLC